ncbi:MAG TPA: ATP phosphoribosyltransferase [Pirellulaceae bacterium]|nr:ATP phosphoribosyltransferase [Pirellulaceae bacterium]
MSPTSDPETLRLALPKGRMYEDVIRVLGDAGIDVRVSERDYRPTISLDQVNAKILKPRNVISMLQAGSRDIGFAGCDWVVESQAELVELLDTGLNPVRLVAAAPTSILEQGNLPRRPLVIATEYTRLAEQWIESRGIDATVVTTYGATEVFPPEDADVIIDNTATGATLRANGLTILDEIMKSTTRLYASRQCWAQPQLAQRAADLAMILKSVLEARGRVMLDLNVAQDKLRQVLACLPSMKQPTISSLSEDGWYAIRAAVPRSVLARVIPQLKAAGACDIVTTRPEKIVP